MTSKLAIIKLLAEIENAPIQTRKILINGLRTSLEQELCPLTKHGCPAYNEVNQPCNTKTFKDCPTYLHSYIEKVTSQ